MMQTTKKLTQFLKELWKLISLTRTELGVPVNQTLEEAKDKKQGPSEEKNKPQA